MTVTETPLLVCVMGHAGPAGVVQRGEFVRADDPRVQQAPSWFVSASLPESEWGVTPFDGALAAIEAENRAREDAEHKVRVARANRNPVNLEAPSIVKASGDVLDLERGRKILKGSTLLATEPVVAKHPDLFRPAR